MNELSDKQVAAMSPDALAPAAIEAKAEAVALAKAATPVSRTFVLAVFAGMFIAFGGAFFGMFLGDTTLPFGVQRVLGGLLFCLGLELVLCCGAELFTGNTLMVCAKLSGKIPWGAILKNWVVVWLGNLAGGLLAAFLLYMSNLQGMNAGAVGDSFVSLAAGKVTLDWVTLLFKAILCNVFVCLAVWIGFGARTVVDKVVGILLPIAAFVAMGFEHCVANMFFLSMGLACKAAGFGASVVNVDALTVGGMVYNLAFATIGNIIGGAVLVGVGYWLVYHKKGQDAAAK